MFELTEDGLLMARKGRLRPACVGAPPTPGETVRLTPCAPPTITMVGHVPLVCHSCVTRVRCGSDVTHVCRGCRYEFARILLIENSTYLEFQSVVNNALKLKNTLSHANPLIYSK